MLAPGDLAPDFELPDDRGGSVRLSTLLADGPILLYFYPADFTPVCTRQACAMRDSHPALSSAGCRVFGVSPQGVASHERFRDKHELPFPLLVDESKSVTRAYGALGGFGWLVRRTTYLIDRDRVVLDVARSDFRLGPHVALVERAKERFSGSTST